MPKQYRELAGEPVIRPALLRFLPIRRLARCNRSFTGGSGHFSRRDHGPAKDVAASVGRRDAAGVGARRSRGIEQKQTALVLIHDAARPFVSAALLAVPSRRQKTRRRRTRRAIADTVKRIDNTAVVTETLDRNLLRTVQTPQAFGFGLIMTAHRRAASEAGG